MQAYDVKNKKIIIVEKINENGAVIEYSLPNKPGIKFSPLIDKNGKNISEYKML